MSVVVFNDSFSYFNASSIFFPFFFRSFVRSSVLSDVGAALQQQHQQQPSSAKDVATKSLMADQRNDSPVLNLQTGTTSTATRDKSEETPLSRH